jgi:VCBS repeat protein
MRRFALTLLLSCAALLGQARSAGAGPEPEGAPPAPQLAAEVDARDYNRAGRDLLAALGPFKGALRSGVLETLAGSLGPQASARGMDWRADSAPGHLIETHRAAAGGPLAEGPLGLLAQLRAPLADVEDAEFKLDLLERVTSGQVVARLRVRLTGQLPPSAGAARRGRASLDASLHSRWARGPEGLRLEHLQLRSGQLVSGSGDAFWDEAIPRGLLSIGTADPRFLPPQNPLRYQVVRHAIGGASAADIDGDGRDDLLLTQGDGLRLFLNRQDAEGGLRFVEGTRAWGLGGVAHPNVALALDFDGDGDRDLFVGSFYGPNHLFENARGTFRDVTASSGLSQDDMTAIACAADFDGDGRLDLYLGRFLDARRDVPQTMLYTRNGAPNRLYRGLEGLRFEDLSEASGAGDRGLTLGAAAGDLDEDGDVDLYLSNDYGRNVLLRNRGDGTFEDVALESGALAVSGGMSSTMSDLDGDGRLDLYVSSIRSNQRWFSEDVNVRSYVLGIVRSERRTGMQRLFYDLRKHMGADWPSVGRASLKGNYFLRQSPAGTFEDWSERSGAAPAGWFWSSGAADLDNDGAPDLVAVNGWITGKRKDDL